MTSKRTGIIVGWILVGLLLLFSGCGDVENANKSTQITIRVMTFNVLRPEWSRPEYPGWSERKSVAQKVLVKYQPDTIGLQEESAEQLNDLLSSYTVMKAAGERPHIGGIILYHVDKWQLLEQGQLPMPARADDSEMAVRTAQWALLEAKAIGRQIAIYNCHFAPFDEKARLLTAQRIASHAWQWIEKKVPIIFTGDFNATENTETMAYLLGGSGPVTFKSAWRVVHGPQDYIEAVRTIEQGQHIFNKTETKSPLTEEERQLLDNQKLAATIHAADGKPWHHKIDYILISRGIGVEQAEVIRLEENGVYPSDHYPVFAVLVLE